MHPEAYQQLAYDSAVIHVCVPPVSRSVPFYQHTMCLGFDQRIWGLLLHCADMLLPSTVLYGFRSQS